MTITTWGARVHYAVKGRTGRWLPLCGSVIRSSWRMRPAGTVTCRFCLRLMEVR